MSLVDYFGIVGVPFPPQVSVFAPPKCHTVWYVSPIKTCITL